MIQQTETWDINSHTAIVTVHNSELILSTRLTLPVGFWVYCEIRNESGQPVFGAPILSPDNQILTFPTNDAALEEARSLLLDE